MTNKCFFSPVPQCTCFIHVKPLAYTANPPRILLTIAQLDNKNNANNNSRY